MWGRVVKWARHIHIRESSISFVACVPVAILLVILSLSRVPADYWWQIACAGIASTSLGICLSRLVSVAQRRIALAELAFDTTERDSSEFKQFFDGDGRRVFRYFCNTAVNCGLWVYVCVNLSNHALNRPTNDTAAWICSGVHCVVGSSEGCRLHGHCPRAS